VSKDLRNCDEISIIVASIVGKQFIITFG